jgi:hypothetical protein
LKKNLQAFCIFRLPSQTMLTQSAASISKLEISNLNVIRVAFVDTILKNKAKNRVVT